ncbi:type VII secretion protein EccCa [Saccharopolyspora sp. 5N102]|uniref:type VII secretion protein EccCa n=1 Tax=Saccharopolyspora sp. 5N102 TaxID=3375155 RepID=UPI0037A101AF
MPSGELSLQEPPVIPEQVSGGFGGLLMYLPMALGSAAMMMMFMGRGSSGGMGGIGLVMVAVMAVGMLAMGFGQMGRGIGERKRRLQGERRDYLRYLGQMRKQVRGVAADQRKALAWRHPDPAGLWSVALSARLWERRLSHADFAEIRIGLSAQRLALKMTPVQSKPVEDLEPLSARALRRFIRAYTTVDNLPTALFLRGFSQVQMRGDTEAARRLTRAMLAQLATFHSPDDLRIAVCAGPDRMPEWDWVKWLPHAQHGSEQDGAGQVRMLTDSIQGLEALLGSELADRGRFEAGASPTRDEPFVLMILDGVSAPAESRLAGAGYRNATVLSLEMAGQPQRTTLRLEVAADKIEMIRLNRSGAEVRTELGRPDSLSVGKAESLARTLAPFRLSANTDIVEPMVTDFDLGALLDVGEMDQLDPARIWARTAPQDRLRVPIGIAENGSKVELDIKESAQGGMGPHGLLIGATGSGKSELLRTLVLAMAINHSSEILNFVLVDFKGGATFLGLDQLPHTSAVITNLADEAPLVTRMQDALQGEMTRRQELLRKAGNYSSLLDYEKARAGGAPLAPMPSLFLVVDEFSELLASHPDFAELFVMIGRLGRSLGVHLLLASQRIDDGRMHKLESHLSYRIGLRTFSAMESRSVIGVPDAYQLPSAPGNGYLRSDVATLSRFKAAYVSAPFKRRTAEQRKAEISRQVVPFGAARLPEVRDDLPPEPVPEAEGADENTETLLEVAVSRMRGQGPPAHQVWLPPLTEPPTLDELLPPLTPHPQLGLTASGAVRGDLVAPVGVIDKPYEQARDLYLVDLSGVGGHVGIAGGPQSGKSTLLRTLIAGLALTHSPSEVQFYCLDFGGGTLQTLSELPHVGGIAGRMDGERVSRTVAEVQSVLANREKRFAQLGVESMAEYRAMRRQGKVPDDPFGDVFLVVDNWGTLRADFEQHDQTIRQLASRGLTYGVHLMVTTSRWADIHSALRDQLGTRLELRLGDSIDSVIDMRAAAGVPRNPGRGLTMDKLHFLSAVPRIDGLRRTDDLAQGARRLSEAVADNWDGPEAAQVRMLPSVLDAADLPAPEGKLRVALGLGESDLQPVWHDFNQQPHLTVLGDNASGKTGLLRLIADAIPKQYAPGEAELILVDSRRVLLDAVPDEYRRGFAFSAAAAAELVGQAAGELRERLPGVDVTPQQLQRRDWWSGPEVFIFVDDYDLLASGMGGPLDSLLDLLPQAADIGLHVILARSAAGSARLSMDSVVRRMQESNTPDLALSCPPTEMPLLNGMRPQQLPAGRAHLVTRRSATLLQTGWLEPRGAVAETGSRA